MNISYFDVTIPVYVKTLTNLKDFLRKGVDHAKETGTSEADFLSLQLSPDMFPLKRQIQIATDNAKGAVTRLTGTAPLVIEDIETTTVELEARIDQVITYLRTFTPDQFAQAATQEVTLPYFPGKQFVGHDFLVEYAIPNFFFHVSMAYAIIRANGVPVGKVDYLGALTLHDTSA